MKVARYVVLLICALCLTGCADTYYSAMEQVGVHKRDIMVDRVEAAQVSQEEAQEQFVSALEQFDSVVKLEDTDLKRAYDKLNGEYEAVVDAAEDVSMRIDKIESVADALFDEWNKELDLYTNASLKAKSKSQLLSTQGRYGEMISSMRRAEGSMAPVLATFQDNVLFLKHNLNAQAIGSLKGEFGSLKSDIDSLIVQMNEAIDSSNTFVEGLQ